jgi:hypothetical protein
VVGSGLHLCSVNCFLGCFYLDEQKAKAYHAPMDEGRKRVLAIVAGILVARHLKTTEDLFDNRSSPRTEAMVAAAVQWAERIMRKIDNVFPSAGR